MEDSSKTAAVDKEYRQAVGFGVKNLSKTLTAPTLFSWFVGLTAIVLAVASLLPLRLLEEVQIGRLSAWLIPLRVWFLVAGAGLLLTEVRYQNKIWNTLFRLALVISYSALALFWWQGFDVGGVWMASMVAVVILVGVVTQVSTLRSFVIFICGLLDGLAVLVWLYPTEVHLSPIVTALGGEGSVGEMTAGVALTLLTVLSIWLYVKNKKALSWLLALTAIPLIGLSLIFAAQDDWQKTFVLLMTGLFAILLPFWDDFVFREEESVAIAWRMFGGMLAASLVTVALIALAQSILIQNQSLTLSDKLTYGKIQTESVVNNAQLAVAGLAQNPLMVRSIRSAKEDLPSLAKGLYDSNQNMFQVQVTDAGGEVLAMYPESSDQPLNVADQEYFVAGISNINGYLSGVVKNYLNSGRDVVAISRPVVNSEGNPLGLVVGFLDLNLLADQLAQIATPKTGEYFILLDGNTNWMIAPAWASVLGIGSGNPITLETGRSGLNRQGYSVDGQLTIAATQPLTIDSWQLFLGVPFFGALNVKETAYIAVLAVTVLIVLIIGLTVLAERVKKKGLTGVADESKRQ